LVQVRRLAEIRRALRHHRVSGIGGLNMTTRRPHRWQFAALSVALLVTIAASAAADPIRVTNGSFQLNRQNDASLRLSGDGFDAVASIGGETPGYAPASGCYFSPSACGGAFTLSISDSVAPYPADPSVGGTIQAGADLYTITGFSYSIAAGPVVPPPPATDATLTAPFTFTGTLLGDLNGGSRSFALSGSGTVTASYLADNGWIGTTYAFAAAPSPTPEPASMLLIGTGLAGLFAQRRRRNRRQN
jgi:hypothetical protein